jgi:squalene-hopene/tetraprenyl-beta-curcumene cyclase
MADDGAIPRLDRGIDQATTALCAAQRTDGSWRGHTEMGVTTTIQDIFQRHYLGVLDADDLGRSANYVRNRQRSDGGWAKSWDGDAELSPSIESYMLMRLAGDQPDDAHMLQAAAVIRDLGGRGRAQSFPTKLWLAVLGQISWNDLHPIPIEILLFPERSMLGLNAFAAWIRQLIVVGSLMSRHRPVAPVDFRTTELVAEDAARAQGLDAFDALDPLLHLARLRPSPFLKPRAEARAERWLLRHQDDAGYWCGGFSFAPIGLRLLGYPLEHPVVRVALEAIDALAVRSGDERFVQPLLSDVGDTLLATRALGCAGLGPDEPPMHAARRFLLAAECRHAGDWKNDRPTLEAGAWAFEVGNYWFPDCDDTAWAVESLTLASGPDDGAAAAAIARGVAWLVGMQCRSGGWGAFSADNTSTLPAALFNRSGPVTDPPTPDVTAHVVEALVPQLGPEAASIRRARDWLLGCQEPEGSWPSGWYVNHVHGTSSVIAALVRAGMSPSHASIERALQWLRAGQNRDGGWGESFRSYTDRTLGAADSTPTQTAWAVLGQVVVDPAHDSVRRGVEYLLRTQRPDGRWREDRFTAAALAPLYDIRYTLQSELIYPLHALAAYRSTQQGHGGPPTRAVLTRR